MAKKPDIVTVSSGYYSTEVMNANFTELRDAFDNTLSLDGSTPNAMNADLDLNNNDILNVGVLDVQDLSVDGNSVEGYLTEVEAARDAAEASAATATTKASEASTSADEAAASAALIDTDNLWKYGEIPAHTSTDFNSGDLIVGGIYTVTGSITNGPDGAGAATYYGTVQVLERDFSGGARITQILSIADSDGSSPKLYTRVGSGVSITWGDWEELATVSSIVIEESGTWTPVIASYQFPATVTTAWSATVDYATYSKIGRRVFVDLKLTSITKDGGATGTDQMCIDGLPFSPAQNTFATLTTSGVTTTGDPVGVFANPYGILIDVLLLHSDPSALDTLLVSHFPASSAVVRLQFCYLTDD